MATVAMTPDQFELLVRRLIAVGTSKDLQPNSEVLSKPAGFPNCFRRGQFVYVCFFEIWNAAS